MRTRRIALLAAFVGLVGLLSGVAVAAHSFTDVPDDHTFHGDIAWLKDNDIAWLKDNDITRGCNPPAKTEFCPDDNVTRGEMAAFLHRFANNVAGEDGVVGPPGPQGPEGPVGPTGRAVNNFNFGDTYCHTVVDTPTFNCYDYMSPSSNEQNETNGWAH